MNVLLEENLGESIWWFAKFTIQILTVPRDIYKESKQAGNHQRFPLSNICAI